MDGAIPLIVMLGVPFLAPLVGVQIRGAVFLVGALFLAFAAAMAAGGARRPGEPPMAWRLYAVAAGTLALATAAAGLLDITGQSLRPALIAAGVPVVPLVAGLVVHLRKRLAQGFRHDGLAEALPGLLVAPALVVPFVLVPGYDYGDGLITGIVTGALVAFCLAAVLSAAGRRAHDARIGRQLTAVTAAVLGATALAALHAAGEAGGIPTAEVGAALYAVAGWVLTSASVAERPALGEVVSLIREVQPPDAAPVPAA